MTSLHHQVWIDAPTEVVFEALATAEGLGSWWAPHTSTETDDGLVLAHSPGEAHGDVKMKVLDSRPKPFWSVHMEREAEYAKRVPE